MEINDFGFGIINSSGNEEKTHDYSDIEVPTFLDKPAKNDSFSKDTKKTNPISNKSAQDVHNEGDIEVPYFTSTKSDESKVIKTSSAYQNEDGDTYEPNKSGSSKKQGVIPTVVLSSIAALLIAIHAKNCFFPTDISHRLPDDYETNGLTVEQVAELEDVDIEAIMRANGLEDGDEVPESIAVPEKYDPVQEQIDELKKKANGAFTSKDDKESIERKIRILNYKKDDLEAVATAYDMGDDIILLVPVKEELTAGQLKRAYNIDEGAILKHNEKSLDPQSITAVYGDTTIHNYDTALIPSEGVWIKKGEIGSLA